jgi:integrase
MGATYTRRGKKFLVAVHSQGKRKYKMVDTEATAKALVREVLKQEILGVNVIAAIEKARAVAPVTPSYPRLRDALPAWIDGQVQASEFRLSTANLYRGMLSGWVYRHPLPDGRVLGDLPVDQVTREMLGAVIRKAKEAGRSRALIGCLRNPLKRFYTMLIETKTLPGPNPAGDLKVFVGKFKKSKPTGLSYFTQEEGPKLINAATIGYPRWSTFIMTGLLAGLRWGESAALYTSDIDWKRGRLHIQRTLARGGRLEPPKDHEGRDVKMSPALAAALRAHLEAMDLEGQMNKWTPEQRRLVFPNTVGGTVRYSKFLETVWKPLLKKAGLAHRRYHSTRHSYATWLLSDGADIRWVSQQLGHSSISITVDIYGHLQPDRHEAAVEGLDRYLTT